MYKQSTRAVLRSLAAVVLGAALAAGGAVNAQSQYPLVCPEPTAKKKPRTIPHVNLDTANRLGKVQEFVDADQFAEAIELLENMAERIRRYNGNERAQIHNMLAYAYYELDDIEKTIYQYEQVLAQMPDIAEGMELTTLNQLSKLYFTEANDFQEAGQEARAQEWFQKALDTMDVWMARSECPGPDAHFYVAQVYYQMKNFDKAIERLELVVAMSRARGLLVREQWWQMLQYLYFEEENWPKVTEVLEILVRDFPKRMYWVNLASVYGETEQYDKQLWTMEAAHTAGFLEMDSDIRTYTGLLLNADLPNRASKYLQLGFDDEVVERTATAMQMLGQAYQVGKDIDKAIPVYEEAAELAEDGNTYDNLSLLYQQKDQPKECSAAAEKALDKGVRNELATRITLGVCQFNMHELNAARDTFVEVRREAREAEARTEERSARQWLTYIANERKRLDELDSR